MTVNKQRKKQRKPKAKAKPKKRAAKPKAKPKHKTGGVTGKGFLPGRSGNPAGRPKKEFCIPDILRSVGNEPADAKNPDGPTKLEVILSRVYDAAFSGNLKAAQFIAERLEGRPRQTIENLGGLMDELKITFEGGRDQGKKDKPNGTKANR